MRKTALFLALMLTAGTAFADTYAFGNRVVSSGDSIGRLVEIAGRPDIVTPRENRYGAREGETWTYFRDGKTLVFTIDTNGKILSISESR
ncbi:hypothetical protein [Pseudoxanthomonas sp. Root630]|uniref:hypothetical protein n=1 Tax=Pseudoxanthomonas sp. Root630 TaxID=1736574 RepID=UPI000702FAE4|nr:hypothetical protein [Pseudoxanthomonas sp. Root630]KRA50544.1 hypothetical protein ASD72_17755 [Pseudoxanthomonas sp. Root630]